MGEDGSVRIFDMRSLESSTIIYEQPEHKPLIKVAWNMNNPNLLAVMAH